MTHSLKLAARRDLTPEICEFTFAAASGPLPSFTAGSHLTVQTPSGAWRSYSISNDDRETDRYVIAVKREEAGRGGSLSMHRQLAVGDVILARSPKNAFELAKDAPTLLIAGGIGITPMLAMLRRLVAKSVPVRLIYLTRSPGLTAYREILSAEPLAAHVTLHHDEGDRSRVFDFWPFFESPDDHHIYYCGPAPMMNAIYLRTIHWPRRQIHSESFAGVDSTDGTASPFRLRRAATGEVFDSPADKSVLDVLRDRGIAFASSCESGTCGTCKMRLVAGEPLHRDLVLTDSEKPSNFMPCVSRAAGEELTLEF
jgi:phthalate 4,5-dioxygenase reductase component